MLLQGRALIQKHTHNDVIEVENNYYLLHISFKINKIFCQSTGKFVNIDKE